MFNSRSHRHRASWSTELKAFSKSIYITYICPWRSAAASNAQCRDCAWRCGECSLRKPSCDGSCRPYRSASRYRRSVSMAVSILYAVS